METQKKETDLMTTQEIAKKMRLKYSTVNKYCSQEPERLPPFFKINGKRLWNPFEVDEWMKARMHLCNRAKEMQ